MLGAGEYEARVFVDGSMDPDHPNEIRMECQTVTAGQSLQVAMAPGGGFVAALHPRSTAAR